MPTPLSSDADIDMCSALRDHCLCFPRRIWRWPRPTTVVTSGPVCTVALTAFYSSAAAEFHDFPAMRTPGSGP
jgi:hypothetical protein